MTTAGVVTQPEAAEAVAWFAEGWRDPDYERFCDHFLPRMHSEVRLVQPLAATGIGHGAFRSQFARLFAVIPDVHARVLGWSSREEDVYIELVLAGTIGWRRVQWEACDRLTVRDGLVVERRSFFDPAPLVKAIAGRPWAWPRLLVASARARAAPSK